MANFTAVNELERLLVAAATDPAARPAFYRALPEHDLLVIPDGYMPEREQSVTLTADVSLKFRTMPIKGTSYVPIFTSVDRISAIVNKQVGFVALKGRDLLSLLRDRDLVINPGSAYGKFLTRQEVSAITDGTIFNPSAMPDVGGKEVLLGQPRDYPRHITEPLARFFAKQRDVKAAYLAHVLVQGADEVPHTLIGVMVAGNWSRIVEEAGVVVREVAKPEEIVDFTQMHAGATNEISEYMLRETKPFYKRKIFGLF